MRVLSGTERDVPEYKQLQDENTENTQKATDDDLCKSSNKDAIEWWSKYVSRVELEKMKRNEKKRLFVMLYIDRHGMMKAKSMETIQIEED